MGFGVATQNGWVANGDMSVEVQVEVWDMAKSSVRPVGYDWRRVRAHIFNHISNQVSTCSLPNL
jgi:hypothetical protein